MPPKVSMIAQIPGEENIPPRSAIPSDTAATTWSFHPDFFPFHVVPGISNFRDIGGWPIPGVGHVRKGVLYRGSDTNKVTPEGITKLRDGLHIKTDFDLRSKEQIEKTGGYKEMEGIERIWAPVFADEEYTEEAARQRYELYAGEGTKGIVTAFIEVLTSGATMFRTVLRRLLESPISSVEGSESTPALFMHCTTGNNRTGVFVSLLLLLLGVQESIVIEEYALSEKGLAPTRHMNVNRLLKKGAFKEYGPEEAKRKCERMVGARPESMRALIEYVKKQRSGPDGYFKNVVGLSEVEISRLKGILTIWKAE